VPTSTIIHIFLRADALPAAVKALKAVQEALKAILVQVIEKETIFIRKRC